MSEANPPIFAPLTYGDDRQVTRTRRGLGCYAEFFLDPELVYGTCFICGYQWWMPKQLYLQGTYPPDNDNPRRGFGGTGDPGLSPNEYSTYTNLVDSSSCLIGGISECDGTSITRLQVGTLTPYSVESLVDTTSIIGDYKLYIDSTSLPWDEVSPIPIYMECIGGSGSAGLTAGPKLWGGFPLYCPNCCKVNFQCKWIQHNDAVQRDTLGIKIEYKRMCKASIIIDRQKIRSHF